jgi:deoxyribodipyrimidine photo-lyase
MRCECRPKSSTPTAPYLHRGIPELERLEARAIHRLWKTSRDALARAGAVLGKTYPKPIVDHAFDELRSAG